MRRILIHLWTMDKTRSCRNVFWGAVFTSLIVYTIYCTTIAPPSWTADDLSNTQQSIHTSKSGKAKNYNAPWEDTYTEGTKVIASVEVINDEEKEVIGQEPIANTNTKETEAVRKGPIAKIDTKEKKLIKQSPTESVLKSPERDLNDKIIYPWGNDPLCKQHNITFGRNMKRAFLVSYPRSGNSWVRYLVEGASGIFTGSHFKSSMLAKMGFAGEKLSFKTRRTILIKMHKVTRKKVKSYSPVVLLIRNPARSLISYWNYENGKSGKKRITFNRPVESYSTPEFDEFVKNRIQTWAKIAIDRLKYSGKLLVVHYEQVKEDVVTQIRRILKFLKVPPDEERLKCVSLHPNGPAKGLQREIDPYTPSQRQVMAKYVREVQDLLKKRGMPPLPDYPEIPL